MSEPDVFDVAILGAGPAGLAAALYTGRDRYATVVLEKNGLPGGQIMLTETIENYPGFDSVGGPELVDRMKSQAEAFGAEIRTSAEVTRLQRLESENLLEIEINDGEQTLRARSLILSPGSDYRQLGVPGESEMRQMGKVSYCATCDGAFYRDKHVLTVGGGNTAVEDTVYLATRFVKKATMIHRRTEFRAQKVLVEELYDTAETHDVEIKLPYVLERIVPDGDGVEIDHVEIRNRQSDQVESLEVDGVFIFVGMKPNTKFLDGFIELDENGYIPCEPVALRTRVPGVFVAGDCRTNAPLQLATACGDGVTAAMALKQYFRDPDWWETGLFDTEGATW